MSHFLVHANFDSIVFNSLNFFWKKKSFSKKFFPKCQISPKKLWHKNAIKKVRGVIFQNCVSYQWGFFWKNVGIFEKFWWGSKMGIFGGGVGIFTQKHLAALYTVSYKQNAHSRASTETSKHSELQSSQKFAMPLVLKVQLISKAKALYSVACFYGLSWPWRPFQKWLFWTNGAVFEEPIW